MSEQRQRKEQPNQANISAAPKTGDEGGFCLWLAALAFVLAILLHESLFGGKGLAPADGIFHFLPWRTAASHPSNFLLSDQYELFVPLHEWMHQQFLHGRFPLWNPYMDCGAPTVAGMQGALLFPINLLLLPLDPFYAAGIAAFLKLFLAGWFTMLYTRTLGAGNSGAFLAALVFSLSGFMICWLGHPHVNCAMWLPLLLYFIEKSFQCRDDGERGAGVHSIRIWAGFAVAFACMILGGHPPTAVHIAVFTSIYFLFRLGWRDSGQRLPRVSLALGAVVVGLFLAAPQWMPFLEYYHQSSVEDAAKTVDRSASRLPAEAAIFYLLPHLAGSPTEGFEENINQLDGKNVLPNFNERTGYVGILPWLFAIYGMVTRRGRHIVFFGSTLVICLLGVYGVPPFPAIFGALSVLRDIDPTRLIMLAGFAVAILAGLGWDKFQKENSHPLKLLVAAVFWGGIMVALGLWWNRFEPPWSQLDIDHRNFLRPQFFMLAAAFIESFILILLVAARQQFLARAVALGWTAIDLLVFGMGYNPAIARENYYPATPAIEWLQRDTSDFRIVAAERLLVPNTAQIYGLKDIRGYDCTTQRRYEQLITGKTGDFFFYCIADSLPMALPLLDVKYVMTPNSLPADPALFDLVYSNEVSIFRNRSFRSRAMTVFNYRVEDSSSILREVRSGTFDPARVLLLENKPEFQTDTGTAGTNSSARIISDEPDEIKIEASMPRRGFLLLLDNWFPGWEATVNGQNAPVLRADYNFRAVPLDAGESVVRFIYRPASFRHGMLLFFAGLVVVVLAAGGPWLYNRRRFNSPPE